MEDIINIPKEEVIVRDYPDEKKVGGILELFYFMLVKPSMGIKRLIEKPSIFWSIMVVIFTSLSITVDYTLISGGVKDNIVGTILSFGLMFNLIGTFCYWVILAAIVHLFAEWLGGEGKVKILFVGLGFAYLPQIFTTPVALIAVMGGGIIEQIVIYMFLKSILWIWTLSLQIILIKMVYNLSKTRSFMALILPSYVFCSIMVLLTILVVAMITSFTGGH